MEPIVTGACHVPAAACIATGDEAAAAIDAAI